MNNNITLGMDLPQLNLANFKILNSNKLDINKYFQQLGSITETIKDEDIRNDIFHRYVSLRRERNSEFYEAYSDFFDQVLNNTFNSEIKKAFEVGEFYTTKEVKEKLKQLYSHEFAPYDLFYKTPTMTDLEKNNWFRYNYKSFRGLSEITNGILITESLL